MPLPPSKGKSLNSLSSAERLRKLATIFILGQALILAFFVAGTHGAIVRLDKPNTTDFVSFYAAGALADQGRAQDTYDVARHHAAEEAAREPGIEYEFFFYPPTFMLLCAPLARLPYMAAFLLFEVLTGLFWLRFATQAAGGGRAAMATLLAVSSVFWTLGIGQNSFLSAGLMALGTLLLQRRPAAAGAAFGALCFKPHLGLLIPVALLAGRHFRAFAAAAVTVVALIGLSALLFGVQAWTAYLHMLTHLPATVEGGVIQFRGHVDPYGAARLAGIGTRTAGIIQITSAVIATCAVGWLWWRRDPRPETRYAALAAGVLMVTPFALFYDLLMTAVAGAWLVRAARARGFLPGEKLVLALAFLVDLAGFPAALRLHLAIGVLVPPALMVLALRRAAFEKGQEKSVLFEKKNQQTFACLGWASSGFCAF